VGWLTFDAEFADDQVVLRPSAFQRWGAAALAIVVVPLLTVGIVGGVTVGSGLLVLLAMVVGLLGGSVMAWRSRVTMDAQGVTVRGIRTRQLRWEEVVAVEAIEIREWRTALGGSHPIQPALVTSGGDRIHLPVNAGWIDLDGGANDDAARLRNLVTRSAWRFGGQQVESRARKRWPT
jgi:hypothetical protein